MQTVSFTKLATAFDSNVETQSSLRRIQRFMANYNLSMDVIAKFIIYMLPIESPYILSMDRTNWKLGKLDINILVVAITYKGVAFPILYTMLPKCGNSNTQERMDIINRFIDLFGIESIKYLVADREFVGKEWMTYLNDLRLRYYLRIKGNFYIDDPRTAKRVKASHLFNSVRINEFRSQPNIYRLKGEYCYLAASKIKNKESELI